jgi:predicted TIM-barrel fold metal-dependent hydrolase
MTGPAERIIDVHAHFVTDHYITAAKAAGHQLPDGMPWASWDPGSHLDLMDRTGVGTSVLSVSSPGTHFGDDKAARTLSRRVNEFAADLVGKHPERFGHFASLPLPDIEGSLVELAHALDVLGSDGVTLETNTHGIYLGDPRYETVWAELDRRHATVFVHPTSPPCWEAISLGRPRPMLEFIFDSTRAVSDLVFAGVPTRYPNIEWILTHGGGALPLLADRIELFRTGLPHDSSSDGGNAAEPLETLMQRAWFDMAGTPFPHQVPAVVRAFGRERLLYGSDYCWTPADAVVAQIASVDAADQPARDTWRALTTRNATRLLPRIATTNEATP